MYFLEYGTVRKGYRLYDNKTSRIVYSCDIVFNKSSRGCESEERRSLFKWKALQKRYRPQRSPNFRSMVPGP